MRIEWIHIKGFRNFIDEKINFANQTLIIGANDIGKSNLIYALRILFDRSLSDQDLELNINDYNVFTDTNEIKITVKISDIKEDCLKTAFKGDIKDEATFIQYKNNKNGEYAILIGKTEANLEERPSRFYLKRINLEYVNTNRNLESFIKREKKQIIENTKLILSDSQIKDDNNKISEINNNLKIINADIDKLNYINKSLDSVNKEMKLLSIHNENKELNFKAKDSDANQMLANLQLTYSMEEGSLTLGGDGRSNQIFLATWVAKQKQINSLEKVTFYAIEEPEAHLHPQQQKKLSSYLLKEFEEQVFITTHSPYIASEFKPNRIVKLYSEGVYTKAAQNGCSENLKLTFDDFGYRLDAITSDVFFVNGIFLVEGPSEKLFYTALAKELNYDLDRLNISIISVNGVGFKPYIKICLALNIPFVLRTDNDVFSKTKNKIEYEYNGGISRVMGIYLEILKVKEESDLEIYWNKNKIKNEWTKGISQPLEAKKIANEIINKINEFNMFVSDTDLENDMVNSEIFSSLKKHYKTRTSNSTVKKMQKAKAENMVNYLQKNVSELTLLTNNKLLDPLTRIKKLVEESVNG